MELDKVKDLYDVYRAKMSRLELETVRDALAGCGHDPVADDLHAAIVWYLDELPKPGESKEEKDDKKGEEPPEVTQPTPPAPPDSVEAEADKILPDPAQLEI